MNSYEYLDNLLKANSNEIYYFRRLELNDYDKGYFELLSQLTICNKCSNEEWKNRYNEISSNKFIEIIVIENMKDKTIIGTLTIIIEPKFIRNLGLVCHIEDIVIDSGHRKNQMGSKLVEICIEYAKFKKCYKIILDCDEKVKYFYEKAGFSCRSLGMSMYLEKSTN
jgi:glucosamine-phosphate N-acetyltransferase